MLIRQAKASDAEDLRVLFHKFLTQYPPKEEQDMDLWRKVIENVVTHEDYRKRGFASALLDKATEIAKEFNCYKVFLETGSQKESTLNFYSSCGFAMDQKHSFQKRFI